MRDLYQRKKGGVFWCEFYDRDGRRARRSTKCRDRRAAALVRQRLEREAQDPNRPPEDSTSGAARTVDAALEHFVNHGTDPDLSDATLSMYLQKSGHLRRLLGPRPLADLRDVTVMQGYIKTRVGEGAARGTIHKELVTMRQAMFAALEAKMIDFDPRACFPRYRVKYVPRERWLPPGEAVELLAVLPPHRQLWVVLALYTGGRDSEVDRLTWEHMNWRDRIVHVPGEKTDAAARDIPLQPVLADVLARCRTPGSSGPIAGEWLNVRRDLHAACARAKIDPCSPNDLRRTFATWLINRGVPPNVVAALMGHGSTRMVEKVYGRVKRALMRREIAKLSGACTTGVPDSGPVEASESLVSESALTQLAETLTNPVLGPGIEPGTRGFSIRVHVSKYKSLSAKKLACTTSVPRTRARVG